MMISTDCLWVCYVCMFIRQMASIADSASTAHANMEALNHRFNAITSDR
jgi:hypothetical protein